jgi:uncharacterized membrane protein YoaK (UPF0700 family)
MVLRLVSPLRFLGFLILLGLLEHAAAFPSSTISQVNPTFAHASHPSSPLTKNLESEIISTEDHPLTEGARQKKKLVLPALSKKTTFLICLLGLSGVTEAICLRRFKVFPNMMTGNTVRCIDALVDNRLHDSRMYICMILSYVFGGAFFKYFDKAKTFQNTPNLIWLSRITFGIFILSDLLAFFIRDDMRLFPMAVAFGMINSCTQEAIGAVTNAITGHYGKIGLGLGESFFLQLHQSGNEKTETLNKGFISSIQGVSAFGMALFATNVVFQWIESKTWILSHLPPLGVSLGTVYLGLLGWYCREDGDD